MRIRSFFGLVFCNIFWSLHPVFGKWILRDFEPLQAAWLRYSSALLGYIILWALFRKKIFPLKRQQSLFFLPASTRDRFLLIFLGFMVFCFSPLTQLTGLVTSMASENALIVALEPLVTLALAWLILRERVRLSDGLGFLLGLLGFVSLAGFLGVMTPQVQGTHGFGNFLILISLLGEASFTVLGKTLIYKYSPSHIFGTSLFFGVIFLTIGTFRVHFFSDFSVVSLLGAQFLLSQFTWRSLLGIVCIGPIGTTLGYLYYLFILKETTVVNAALLLFLQPLTGILWGYLIFEEKLVISQLLGGVLIFFAVLVTNFEHLKKTVTFKEIT